MIKLYFFGDSVCFGQYVSPHKTWVHMISQEFPDMLIQNPSVNGDITRTALDRMHHDVLSHKPDMVYIQFGINDCNIWDTDRGVTRVPIISFISNLDEMIDRCKAFGVNTIFLATNHKTGDLKNTEYNEAIRDVSSNLSYVRLIDIESEWEEGLLMEDGIHLNEDGHILYYNIIREVLLNVNK